MKLSDFLISAGGGGISQAQMLAYVDPSLAERDSSITWLFDNSLDITALEPYATNASVGTALQSYATNASIGLADFAKNASLGLYVQKTGDTMSGNLILTSGVRGGFGTSDPSAALHIFSAGGQAANFIISGEGEQGIRILNTSTNDTRASIKFANGNEPDWSWIIYTDSTQTNANDFILQNKNGIVMTCVSEGNINFDKDISIGGSLYNSGMANVSTNYTVCYDPGTDRLTYALTPTSTIWQDPSTGLSSPDSRGTYITINSGTSFVAGNPAYLNTSGNAQVVALSSSDNFPAFGIAVESFGAGSAKFLIHGLYRNTALNFTVGKQVYVGTGGSLTTTRPTTAGDCVQVMGIATSPDSMIVNPSPDFVYLK